MIIQANLYLFSHKNTTTITDTVQAKVKFLELLTDCTVKLIEGNEQKPGTWGRIEIKAEDVPFEYYSIVSPGKEFIIIINNETVGTGDVIRVADY